MAQPALHDRQSVVTATKAAFLEALTAYFTECATEHDSVLRQLMALRCDTRGAQYDAALVALATEITALPDTPARADVLQQIDQQRHRVKHLLASVQD